MIGMIILLICVLAFGIGFSVMRSDDTAHAAGHEHDGITFTEWTNSTKLPTTAGNYYLTRDYSLSDYWKPTVGTGVIRLCLNGHKITFNSNSRYISLDGVELHIYDCDTTTNHYYHVESSGSYTWTVVTDTPTQNDIGSFTGGYIGATVNANNCNSSFIGGIRGKTGSSCHLHSGTIVGAYGSNGGAMARYDTGSKPDYYMYGGRIVGTADASAVVGDSFTMTGGTITHNYAKYGAVAAKTITISGGAITDNFSTAANGFGKEAAIVVWDNLNLSGDINISGNHVATVGSGTIVRSDKEVDLSSDYYSQYCGTINIVGELNLAAPVYNDFNFNSNMERKTITNGFSTYISTNKPTDYFRNTKGYDVRLTADGEVEYVNPLYTVTFNDSDGAEISSARYASDDAIAPVSAPEKDGFLFEGWTCDTDENLYTSEQIANLVASDVANNTGKSATFTATYKEISIEFTTVVEGETTRYIDNTNVGDTVVVTYKITQNNGFNSMLLIPEYDTSVFAIQSVSVDNETVLGEATIGQDNNVKKIAWENTGDKYNALNESFLTVTYTIISAKEGEYTFGLDLTTTGENNRSVAYFIENEGDVKGEQTEVSISLVYENQLTLICRKTATITIGSNNADEDVDNYGIVWDYFFVYNKEAIGLQKVDVLKEASETFGDHYVEYTYTGDAIPVVAWYYADQQYDEQEGKWNFLPGSELNAAAPIMAGDYVIGISAPESSAYYAVEEVYAYVHINTRLVEVTIASKTSAFNESIVPLTYTTNIEPFEGDSFNISLFTTAQVGSPVGNYAITGSADPVGSYVFNFTNGTYTITGKAITLTALNQTAEYTGSEPEVDQTKYTITETETGEAYDLDVEVAIGKQEGVVAGSYILTPGFASEMNGYEVTYVNGTFTITSVGAEVDAVKAYFAGLEKVYNGSQQDLLAVGELPTYYYYVASGNMQKDVNEYTITVTVHADINHNIAGESSCVFTVNGEITPLAVTLTAIDVNV